MVVYCTVQCSAGAVLNSVPDPQCSGLLYSAVKKSQKTLMLGVMGGLLKDEDEFIFENCAQYFWLNDQRLKDWPWTVSKYSSLNR